MRIEFPIKDKESKITLLYTDKLSLDSERGEEPPGNLFIEDLGEFVHWSRKDNCYLLDTDKLGVKR